MSVSTEKVDWCVVVLQEFSGAEETGLCNVRKNLVNILNKYYTFFLFYNIKIDHNNSKCGVYCRVEAGI